MTKTEFINTVKNHPKYNELKKSIIERPIGSKFKPRYDMDNKFHCYIMRMLLQEAIDEGLIAPYLHYTFIRIDF